MTSSHTSTLRRLGASALLGTAATVALAAPSQAMFVHDPVTDGSPGATSTTTTANQADDGGWQLLQVGVGAAGGVVLAGAAVGAAAGLHRRRAHVAHPA